MSQVESRKLQVEEDAPQDPGSLKARVLELSGRVHALVADRVDHIHDTDLAQELAAAVKPYVDRLVALKRLLNPVDRIVVKQVQIEELEAGIAQDVAEVEDLSDQVAQDLEETLLADLESEIAAVKRDRKLHVTEIEADETEPASPQASRPRPLLELSLPERFERIFGERFVSLSRIAQVLQVEMAEGEANTYEAALDQVWTAVFDTAELAPHVQRNRAKALQTTFGDYALLFRLPRLAGGRPCTLNHLRQQFGAFFLHLSAQALWYTGLEFARATFDRPHWALVDRQYLNCTFKKPSIRLLMYARANQLPPRIVRQKSALEDVYDRIVLELTLRTPFFEGCNSITRTTYQLDGGEIRQVYVYGKDASIRVSGRRGTPHWRPTRPRWPGVLPSVVFPA
ncbi:MAG: hypothetical protein AB1505_10060 [Candidatus Latescibacterota bacterium]